MEGFGVVPTPRRFSSVQVKKVLNSALFVNFGVTARTWCYSWGALHFDSYRNGDLQCQEFKPWGGRWYIWTWCCMLPSSAVLHWGRYMLYLSSVSGLVAHSTAAISLGLFKSVRTHVKHVVHNRNVQLLGKSNGQRGLRIQQHLHKYSVFWGISAFYFAITTSRFAFFINLSDDYF